MNVEIGTEAAQFPEKKDINGIFVAVRGLILQSLNFYVGKQDVVVFYPLCYNVHKI
jgi:hypothetical protein